MRPSRTTLGLLVATLASVALYQLDPWASAPAGTSPVHRSSGARLLPELSELPHLGDGPLRVAIEPRGGPALEIVRTPDGHELWQDGALVGPADPEAVEGLWLTLRVATVVRAVADGAAVDVASRGRIRVETHDDMLELVLGADAPGEVGVYASRGQANPNVWVVEAEVAGLLEHGPESWLLRRLLDLTPTQLERVRWDGRAIVRGADGIWRSRPGPVLLANEVVDERLARLLGAAFDPVVPKGPDESVSPWLELHGVRGKVSLGLGGPCPGNPEALVVDRGVGVRGCVSAAVVRSWPPGESEGLESRLAPHDYGRVLAVRQLAPVRRDLRRRGQGWIMEEGAVASPLGEPEVFRFYEDLHRAHVELAQADEARWDPADQLVIETDSTQAIAIDCALQGGEHLCRRDGGPLLRLRSGAAVETHFDLDTFTRPSLLDLAPGEVHGLEVILGPDGPRQSAHLDLGVWLLDAPEADTRELDSERMERLLTAMARARPSASVAVPDRRPERTLRIQRSPRSGRPMTTVVDLYAGCVAHVEGEERAARLDAAACKAFAVDLVVDRPAR